MNEDALARLRVLRMWHWKMHLTFRDLEGRARSKLANDIARVRAEKAAFHMLAVQTLNEHFPIGDTAEQDLQEKKQNATTSNSWRNALSGKTSKLER